MNTTATAHESDILRCSIADHIATVVLNRPHRLNALSRELSRRLVTLMDELSGDDDVRVVTISGAGGRAFCVGADLKDLDADALEGRSVTAPMTGVFRNVFEAVLESAKPTIAVIDGYALAGGMELALACDMRIATRSSQFGMPEAKIGMGANFASIVLPRLVPRVAAFEILYTGERFDAAQAFEWGLLNRVVDQAEVADTAAALARQIASNAPLTVARYKQTLTKSWEMPVPAALRLNVGPNPYASRDREEGIRAFLEHRVPQWKGE